jgi:SAM-dependent methyltransferase
VQFARRNSTRRSSCTEAWFLGEHSAHAWALQRFPKLLHKFQQNHHPSAQDVRLSQEIGLGLGADHEKFAEAGAILHGIDLTERSVRLTKLRLLLRGLISDIRVGDAESLPYESNSFDLIYSWGVIHHTPDTVRAAQEILRVLKPGGEFKVMIYHN